VYPGLRELLLDTYLHGYNVGQVAGVDLHCWKNCLVMGIHRLCLVMDSRIGDCWLVLGNRAQGLLVGNIVSDGSFVR
jgi:hypothetical protein